MQFEFFIDLDNVNEGMLNIYLELIKHIAKYRLLKLTYRLSSGGNGYHVGVALDVPDRFKDNIKDFDSFKLGLRYLFLDCYGRLKMDMARLWINQDMDRLAIYKNGKYAGEWKTIYTRKPLHK